MLLQTQQNGFASKGGLDLARRVPYLNASQQAASNGQAKLKDKFSLDTTVRSFGRR